MKIGAERTAYAGYRTFRDPTAEFALRGDDEGSFQAATPDPLSLKIASLQNALHTLYQHKGAFRGRKHEFHELRRELVAQIHECETMRSTK